MKNLQSDENVKPSNLVSKVLFSINFERILDKAVAFRMHL